MIAGRTVRDAGETVQASVAASGASCLQNPRRMHVLIDAVGEYGLSALIEAFLSDAYRLLGQLHAAMKTGNGRDAARVLHSLRGSAVNLGFDDFARVAEEMECGGPDAAAVAKIDRMLREITSETTG